MEKIVFDDYKLLSKEIAKEIVMQIKLKPDSIICLAGGDSPKGVYEELVKLLNNKVNYSKITFVSLDEWVGLDETEIGSCKQTLYSQLFNKLNLRDEQVLFFDGKSSNLDNDCLQMTNFINSMNGIDYLLLGVGMNGHLGFNEPGIRTGNCSVVNLDDTTKKVMQKYFKKNLKPSQGITLGYNQINSSKKVVLMANGKHKARIIKKIIESEPTITIPATLLKLHKNVKIYVDKSADEEEI
ncbi:MAG: glucosamine-6-phosphate deaminase [Bacilli bacterium]